MSAALVPSPSAKVFDALARLPDSPTKVAAEFRRLGIIGRRGDPFACPLANYLTRLVDGSAVVSVSHSTARVLSLRHDGAAHELPLAVRAFVRQFDAVLAHADLIDQSPLPDTIQSDYEIVEDES